MCDKTRGINLSNHPLFTSFRQIFDHIFASENKVFSTKKSEMRVVILNQHGVLYFCVFICFVTGSECMDAPFFLKGQYIEKVTRENLFFPWRSPLSTYDTLYEGKSRKYSLFWTEGNFGGKGRTPGERLPNCLKLTH